MGFLSNLGKTLKFDESQDYQDSIKKFGIEQLLKMLSNYQSKQNSDEERLWGDEIEIHVLKFDHENKRVFLSLDAKQILNDIVGIIKESKEIGFLLQPEYGQWMMETVPKDPYVYNISLEDIIHGLYGRRKVLQKFLNERGVDFMNFTAFPTMGINDFFYSENKTLIANDNRDIAKSLFIPDFLINDHPRFPTLTSNIRNRRGGKTVIEMPLFIDEFTKFEKSELNPIEGKIFMDAPAFGMGNCSIQITFSPKSISEGRYLYDQMTTLGPIIVQPSNSECTFSWNIDSSRTFERL